MREPISAQQKIIDQRLKSDVHKRSMADAVIRLLDVTIAAMAIIALLPLAIILILVIKLSDPGPAVFGHARVGRNNRSFRCLKFRTMVMDAEDRLIALLTNDAVARAEWILNHKLTDDPRITRIGRFLRTTSLDELPQLWNIVRGEMSLVGPRPIVVEEVERYGRYFADYTNIRPGLTGLWQISGRSNTSYRRRVALDVAYSRSYDVKLYLRILVLTVPAVVLQRGSY